MMPEPAIAPPLRQPRDCRAAYGGRMASHKAATAAEVQHFTDIPNIGPAMAKDFGVPSLNALATMSMDLTDATGSSADIVRVAVRRVKS